MSGNMNLLGPFPISQYGNQNQGGRQGIDETPGNPQRTPDMGKQQAFRIEQKVIDKHRPQTQTHEFDAPTGIDGGIPEILFHQHHAEDGQRDM